MAILGAYLANPENPQHRKLVFDALAAVSQLPLEQQALLSSLRDLPLDDAVASLRRLREGLPDSSHGEDSTAPSCLDGVLFPLLELQRETDVADILGPYTESKEDPFDVHISDITAEDLPHSVSAALGASYLEPCPAVLWPISGIIYGKNRRILVSTPVTARGKSVRVHFIFDTAAPRTYIASSVLTALGVPDVSLCSEVVRINGVKADVSVSDTTRVQVLTEGGYVEVPCHFKGLNVMGMDFLDRLDGTLTVDMANKRAMLMPAPHE